jgi:type IX secretion system PorP/SprF family membrane protein
MKSVNKIIALLFTAFCLPQTADAQDIHFTQFWMNPMYLNAAQTGVFNGDYRVGGMYRQQWRTIPVNYKTLSLFGDTRFDGVLSEQSSIGVGLIFNNDVAGDSRYTINQLYVPLSYIQHFEKDTNLTVSFGITPGVSNIAFRTDKLTFDNQFDGDAYNSSLSSGEHFPSLSRTYFDFGSTGLHGQYKLKKAGLVSLGTSFSHYNRPGVSFFKNNEVRLYVKSTSFVSIKFPVTYRLFVLGDFMYEKQGPFHELNLVGRLSYMLNPIDNFSLNAGISGRLKDAFILMVGMDYKDWRAGFSYDINRKFTPATNKRGGWEIGLIRILRKKPAFMPKKRICPTDM